MLPALIAFNGTEYVAIGVLLIRAVCPRTSSRAGRSQ
jgi:hypothetical protein